MAISKGGGVELYQLKRCRQEMISCLPGRYKVGEVSRKLRAIVPSCFRVARNLLHENSPDISARINSFNDLTEQDKIQRPPLFDLLEVNWNNLPGTKMSRQLQVDVGKITVKVEPTPGWLSTRISPWWFSTIPLHIDKPRPVPLTVGFVV